MLQQQPVFHVEVHFNHYHHQHFSFVMGLVWFSTVTTTNLPTLKEKKKKKAIVFFLFSFL